MSNRIVDTLVLVELQEAEVYKNKKAKGRSLQRRRRLSKFTTLQRPHQHWPACYADPDLM